jgi:hypothetical protein
LFLTGLAALGQQFGDKSGPSSLVICTDAAAGIPVEILVEKDEVVPVRVVLENLQISSHGTATVFTAQKDSVQATRNLSSYFG